MLTFGALLIGGCSLYEEVDPGAPPPVREGFDVGDCVHLSAFSDAPTETTAEPTPARCGDGVEANAVVAQTAVPSCAESSAVLRVGDCFALYWSPGACYRTQNGRWVRTGICSSHDPAVVRVAEVTVGLGNCGPGTRKLREVSNAATTICADISQEDSRFHNDVYTVYKDWRAKGFGADYTIIGAGAIAIIGVLFVGRGFRWRRRSAGKPDPSRLYVGGTVTAVALAAVAALVVSAGPGSRASLSQLQQAQAFADDWRIEILDPDTMPGPSALDGVAVEIRDSAGRVRSCVLSTWFRNRETGAWHRDTTTRRGVGSGWQRMELTCSRQ
ncbi:hypothetical protein ACWFPY_02670 [Nocardia fluminea]